jgi:hypothetical protein
MPLQLGYRQAKQRTVLRIEISGTGKVDQIPELIDAKVD